MKFPSSREAAKSSRHYGKDARRGLFCSFSLALLLGGNAASANPDGLKVSAGSAAAVAIGPQLNIRVSDRAVLDWRSFNIGPGETTTFLQPSAASVVWNRINDPNPSKLFGQLNANGVVVLANQAGFYFGPGSVIRAASFVATTSPATPMDLAAGGAWSFTGLPPLASIINYGHIESAAGGSVFLIAEKIENHGTLTAPDGSLGLYAGKEVLVSRRPDGRGLSAQASLPDGVVDNTGKLIADAGSIALQARVVNQDGLVQANSIRERNGVIELVAAEQIILGPNSTINANGAEDSVSDGGQVVIKSGQSFSDTRSSKINTLGGGNGGAGGSVEISAPRLTSVASRIDGHARAGSVGGELRIDPTDIVLANDGDGSAAAGVVNAVDAPDTLRLNVNSAFVGFSQITLQARRDISLAEATSWNLNDSTGISTPDSHLTLQAGRNISFGPASRIVGGLGWSVKLIAGADPSSSDQVHPGIGGIYFSGGPADANGNIPAGNGSLETSDGNIRLIAGNEILVGSGFVRTVGGGNIDIAAKTGDVNAGTKTDGYQFSRFGYTVSSAGLGGIATASGGNVSIEAGRDIVSFLPTSGAYGAEPGDVSLTAGQRVLGSFLVRNGVGQIRAGTDFGSSSSPASLSLIQGEWQVTAERDIFLNEVRNPNAAFNGNRLTTGARIAYQFDYVLDAGVKLDGGNSVQLLGSNLPRTAGNRDLPPIYPPKLDISAGAGGVLLGNDVILFPSPQGSLNVKTADGGSLRSTPANFFQMVMSDSADPNYRSFAAAHAATPVYAANAQEPARFNISGNVENVFLRTPKQTQIDIGGNTLNFGFEGQNLTANDQTEIKLGGDLQSRGNRTLQTLKSAPDFSVLDPLVSVNPDLFARLTYNPATGELSFQGKMRAEERDFLLHPFIRVLDVLGDPQLDAMGNPLLVPVTFTTDAGAIEALYQKTQDIPSSGLAYAGLQLGGPGKFSISARNLDLASTAGIRSVGPLLNEALGKISSTGASIDIKLKGNLEMTASQIGSFSGGSITLVSAGSLNVGSQEQFTSDDTPKGIYSAAGGSVSVSAKGDINVNGSRIAAYDGGNVSVVSAEGDVNAGKGGLGFVVLNKVKVDSATGKVQHDTVTIPGSGILATALPGSPTHVGDIEVKAGKSILASSGGIIQLPFNGSDPTAGAIDLTAGESIDASNSGVIGGNVSLKAQKDIIGLVVASKNININSLQSVSVTALAQGGVNISAGGAVSGTVVGGTGVSVSGEAVSAALVSQNVKTSGDASSASIGVPTTSAASATSKSVQEKDQFAAAAKPKDEDDEELKKRRPSLPMLAKSTGRVTVILPDPVKAN